MGTTRGYVKLWRKSLDSAIWGLPPATWRLWCYILMRAASSEHKVMVPGGEVLVHPGELVTTYRELAEGCAYTERLGRRLSTVKQVRAGVESLLRIGVLEVRQEEGQRYLHLIILHWAAYQGLGDDSLGRGSVIERADLGQTWGRPLGRPEAVENPHVTDLIALYLTCHDGLGRTRPTDAQVDRLTRLAEELLRKGAEPKMLGVAVRELVKAGHAPGMLPYRLAELEAQRRGGPAPQLPPDPEDRQARIQRARDAIAEGAEEMARAFVLDELEWAEAQKGTV